MQIIEQPSRVTVPFKAVTDSFTYVGEYVYSDGKLTSINNCCVSSVKAGNSLNICNFSSNDSGLNLTNMGKDLTLDQQKQIISDINEFITTITSKISQQNPA
jgi:hypothetical protein